MRKIKIALLLIAGYSSSYAQDYFVTQYSPIYGTNVAQDDLTLNVSIGTTTPTSILTVGGTVPSGAISRPIAVVEIDNDASNNVSFLYPSVTIPMWGTAL